MRICFLAGSNSVHSIRWISYFVDRGFEVSWISLAPATPEAQGLIAKTHYYEITPSPLADYSGRQALLNLPGAIRQVRQILKKEQPAVMHLHSAGTYGLVGVFSNFKPTILTPWGSDLFFASRLKRLVQYLVVGRAQLIVCNGEKIRERLLSLGAVETDIRIINFGTDVDIFKPDEGARLPSNLEDSAPEGALKVLSLRAFHPVYDLKTLINAALIVTQQKPNIHFLLVGDGPEKARLKAAVQIAQLQKNVHFLGRVEYVDLPALLNYSDIYVSTSLSDSGLSAATSEAMSCGLPVIVSDSADNRDWIAHNKNGLLFPPSAPQQLAHAILQLADNSALRHKMGASNRALIKEKNNYSEEMAKMAAIYKKMAGVDSPKR
ncbi:hypothetical protein CO046_01080 [Candidatus Peregrinibacteria bacterium CG_4_9_14_0_2_um_filter_53_11]|nr:MAG: hypothetical protein CO046_01080 [Candidatus Peregrinibacteria bacterium CG_4_9_14_0_2_um_filter_53_11]